MSRRDAERVADILHADDEVAEIVGLGRDAWDKERIRQLAVERLLEIIGEAANSLTEDFRSQHQAFPGAKSSACGSCWHTTTTGSTQARCG